MSVPDKVTPGLKFPYHVADGRCIFTVKEHVGSGVWRCVCDADQDYAGSVANVDGHVILGTLQMNASFKEIDDENGVWFDSLPDGTIIHLVHGFKQFVRCRVQTGEYQNVLSKQKVNGKHVVSIALVGEWRSFDLPRWQPDGTSFNPYHADRVLNGTPHRPGPQNMWESPYYQNSSLTDRDPQELEPISLELPVMTQEEVRQAAMVTVRNHVVGMLSEGPPTPEKFRTVIDLLGMYAREVDEDPQEDESQASQVR